MTAQHDRIAELFDTRRYKLDTTTNSRPDWHTTPSLWSLLTDAAGRGYSPGSKAGFGPRVPIATSAIDLHNEIVDHAEDYALRLRRRDLQPIRQHADDGTTYDNAKIRKAISAWYTSGPARPTNLNAANILDDWIRRAAEATGQTADLPRYVRATCPACKAATLTIDDAGEAVRRPALTISWTLHTTTGSKHHQPDDWMVRAITCASCGGSWFRGAELDQLAIHMLEYNHSHATLSADTPT